MTQFLYAYPFLYYSAIIAFSAFIASFAIPSILHVARARHLYDDTGCFRKQHDHGIPRLGGVAIFVSFTLTSLLFSMNNEVLPINYLLTACIILFATGLKDDVSGVNTSTKFALQFIVAAILVLPGDIRLTSMYGVFNIQELPYWPSVILSLLLIIAIINAFNLIDGIDGLAAITGILVNGSFAALFIHMHEYELAAVSLAMVGAILGFLKFNITPAKIFMGDTGSLLIGLMSIVMALRFIELNKPGISPATGDLNAPALAVAILICPILDIVRIFVLRLAKGVSPFKADREHIHHCLLRLGLNHLQATFLLAGLNVSCIGTVLYFNDLGNSILLLLILLIAVLFSYFISAFSRIKGRKNMKLRNSTATGG